jgi:hypothetical protein
MKVPAGAIIPAVVTFLAVLSARELFDEIKGLPIIETACAL